MGLLRKLMFVEELGECHMRGSDSWLVPLCLCSVDIPTGDVPM